MPSVGECRMLARGYVVSNAAATFGGQEMHTLARRKIELGKHVKEMPVKGARLVGKQAALDRY